MVIETLLVYVHKCPEENVSIYQPITWDQVVPFLGEGGVTRPRIYGLGKEGIKQVRQIIAGEPFANRCVTSAIFLSSKATET